jgi:hypothetical protein
MPILGTIASSYLQTTTSYFSLASETLGSSKNTITFNNISSDYTHLQLRIACLYSAGDFQFRINNDTGSNYRYHFSYATGTSRVSANSGSGQTNVAYGGYTTGSTYPQTLIIDFLDYRSTNKNKVMRVHNGTNNGNYIMDISNWWVNSSAITRIDLFPQAGQGDFLTGSSFALYGIKG